MAYKKRTFRSKKRSTRALPWYRRKYSPMELAQKALSGVNYIRGMINCEKKCFTVSGAQTIDQNGYVVPLSQIDMGDNRYQRNGNSLLARSNYSQLEFKLDPAGTNATVRVLIVIDKDNTGTVPSVSNVLQTTGTIVAVTSPLLLDFATNRFKVILDKKITLCSAGSSRTSRKFYQKLYTHIKYTSTLGTDESINQMYMMFVSSEAANLPAVVWSNRLSYYDN